MKDSLCRRLERLEGVLGNAWPIAAIFTHQGATPDTSDLQPREPGRPENLPRAIPFTVMPPRSQVLITRSESAKG